MSIIVVIAIFVALLGVSGAVVGWARHWDEGKRRIIAHVLLGFLIGTLVAALIIGAAFLEARKNEKTYNDGVCARCGGEYYLVGVNRGSYYYECSSCRYSVRTSSEMVPALKTENENTPKTLDK